MYQPVIPLYGWIVFHYMTISQFSSAQLLSRVQLFATSWTVAHQASLSITNSQNLLKFMPIESEMPSNHLILCHPFLFLPSIFPSIRVFSNESALHSRWPRYWSFSFNISASNEYSGLISFRMDWLDLLADNIAFIYPLIHWWALSCFCLLAIVESSAVINMCVHVLIWIPVFNSLGFIPRVLWGHVPFLYWTFWGIVKLFPTTAEPFYLPTSNVKVFQLPHILTLAILLFIIINVKCVSNGTSWRFWFTCFWWLMILSSFSCACRLFVCLLWRNVCSNTLVIFFIGLFVYLLLSCKSYFYMLDPVLCWA